MHYQETAVPLKEEDKNLATPPPAHPNSHGLHQTVTVLHEQVPATTAGPEGDPLFIFSTTR